jgi:hypothetical protein
MSHSQANQGEFEQWKDRPNERQAFLAQLMAVLQKYLFVYLAASAPVYKTMDGKLVVRDDPYFDCLVPILDSASSYLETFELGEKVLRSSFRTIRSMVRSRAKFFLKRADGAAACVIGWCPTHTAYPARSFRYSRPIWWRSRSGKSENERLALRPRDTQRWPLAQLLTKPFYWNGYFRPPSPAP